jgi:ABC-type branched-subunit amino acid transport system ATPase component
MVVLNFGQKLAEGHPAEVQRNPEVIRAYVGEAS